MGSLRRNGWTCLSVASKYFETVSSLSSLPYLNARSYFPAD